MSEKIIKETKSLQKSVVNLTIQLTDFCNFSCKYCVTGKKFSGQYINKNDFEQIETLIKKLKNIYKMVNITISGGEPTLCKDFFLLLKIITNLDVNIIINTNGFIFSKESIKVNELSKLQFVNNIDFNVTFHFKEYEKSFNTFIESIKVLDMYNINYGINFLLPDDEKYEDFIDVRDKILSSLLVNRHTYNLIKLTNGNISESYDNRYLDLFNEKFKQEIKNKNIEIIYDDLEKEKLNTSEILYKGLNKFGGYKCNYFSKQFLNIYINTDLSIYFGSCFTLNRLKYSFAELYILLDKSAEKSIVCGDYSCLCDLDYNSNKKRISNNTFRNSISQIINKLVDKYTEILDLSISNNSIQIILLSKNIYYFVTIEKIIDKNTKYPYTDGELGYHYFTKNLYNEFININQSNKDFINIFMKRLFIFNSIFKKLLNNLNEKNT
ncbi:MAG: radical SAM protein [Candidatus Gracilibacteria bacterium]|nr:radical SAM protein [Candidatus Gracilibacteria bacterium]